MAPSCRSRRNGGFHVRRVSWSSWLATILSRLRTRVPAVSGINLWVCRLQRISDCAYLLCFAFVTTHWIKLNLWSLQTPQWIEAVLVVTRVSWSIILWQIECQGLFADVFQHFFDQGYGNILSILVLLRLLLTLKQWQKVQLFKHNAKMQGIVMFLAFCVFPLLWSSWITFLPQNFVNFVGLCDIVINNEEDLRAVENRVVWIAADWTGILETRAIYAATQKLLLLLFHSFVSVAVFAQQDR